MPVAVILLVIFMYVVAQMINDKEIIFPEIAALGVGAWFIKNSPWGEKLIYLWLSPTLAAITGVGVLHFLPYPKEILIGGTFVLVALELYILRSKVLPSISAAILPIIVNADSLYYVLSVCILSGIIAVGRGLLNHFQSHDNLLPQLASQLKEESKKQGQKAAVHWLKLFIGVIIVATIASRFNWIYLIAPPLIVAFIEFSNTSGKVYQHPVRLFGLILLSAFSGTLGVVLTHLQLHWPLWVSVIGIVLCSFLLFDRFKITFPPAAAISLLPTIVPEEMLMFYPFEVTIGIAGFIVFGKIINCNHSSQEPDQI